MKTQILIGIIILMIGLLTISGITKNKILKFVLRTCWVGGLIVIMNGLLPQYTIGINAYTLTFSILLGIPGIMTLYILQMII